MVSVSCVFVSQVRLAAMASPPPPSPRDHDHGDSGDGQCLPHRLRGDAQQDQGRTVLRPSCQMDGRPLQHERKLVDREARVRLPARDRRV